MVTAAGRRQGGLAGNRENAQLVCAFFSSVLKFAGLIRPLVYPVVTQSQEPLPDDRRL
jgi:hypothetical protein